MASADSGVIDINGVVVFLRNIAKNNIPKGGVCSQVGGDFWFSGAQEDKRAAMEICETCPIKTECAEFGLTQRWGIWGGVDMAKYGLDEMECPNGNIGYYSRERTGTPVCLCPDCDGKDSETNEQ